MQNSTCARFTRVLDAVVFQPPSIVTHPLAITPWSDWSLGIPLKRWNQTTSSAAFSAANMVVYVPFVIPKPVTVTHLFWGNGAGVAGNLDAGIYATDGTLLTSAGTTAQSGTNRPQNVNITDLVLDRGCYYMALVVSTLTTLTVHRVAPAAGICQSMGLLQQDISGTGLPLATNASPATFAKYTQAIIPWFGLRCDVGVGL